MRLPLHREDEYELESRDPPCPELEALIPLSTCPTGDLAQQVKTYKPELEKEGS